MSLGDDIYLVDDIPLGESLACGSAFFLCPISYSWCISGPAHSDQSLSDVLCSTPPSVLRFRIIERHLRRQIVLGTRNHISSNLDNIAIPCGYACNVQGNADLR